MFTATLCFYDIWLYIFVHVVCSVSEECIGNCYLPHKGDLKGIRSCTKGWRPLLIGCNGSLHMRVVFLLRSFKILILNLCLAFVLQSAVDWLQYVLLSISQSLSMFVRSLVTSSWEENSFCPSGNSLSGSSCGLLPFCCCPVDLAFPVELDGLRRKSPIVHLATLDSQQKTMKWDVTSGLWCTHEMHQYTRGNWEIFFQTQKFEVTSIGRWLQQRPKLAAAAVGDCRGHASVRSVASSMKALKAICTNTRTMWTMNSCATSVCSPSSDPWTPRVVTPIASTVWVTSWKSRTSAQWTARDFSCTSAVLPACWSRTSWTSWSWSAPTVQNVSKRCSAVNCSLTCTTGRIHQDNEVDLSINY